MFETAAISISLVLLIATIVMYAWKRWHDAKRVATIVSRLAPALAELEHFYALLELSSERSHFMERHGPILNRIDIQHRALDGSIPYSGTAGRAVSSARWFRHEDLLWAVNSALEYWSRGERPDRGRFSFRFEYPIGEGYKKGTEELVQTKDARVVVLAGQIVTAYPLLDSPRHFDRR